MILLKDDKFIIIFFYCFFFSKWRRHYLSFLLQWKFFTW
jgi:hypothetical protein